jgi:hypothetical protein
MILMNSQQAPGGFHQRGLAKVVLVIGICARLGTEDGNGRW